MNKKKTHNNKKKVQNRKKKKLVLKARKATKMINLMKKFMN